MVTLSYDYSVGRRSTKLSRLVVKGVPAGSTVKATCKKGCSRKSYVKRNARGSVTLSKLIRKRLKAGTQIRVVVSRPGSRAAIKTLRIRPASVRRSSLARSLGRVHAAHGPGEEHGAERERDPEDEQRLEVRRR